MTIKIRRDESEPSRSRTAALNLTLGVRLRVCFLTRLMRSTIAVAIARLHSQHLALEHRDHALRATTT